jgi:hypothetical protein
MTYSDEQRKGLIARLLGAVVGPFADKTDKHAIALAKRCYRIATIMTEEVTTMQPSVAYTTSGPELRDISKLEFTTQPRQTGVCPNCKHKAHPSLRCGEKMDENGDETDFATVECGCLNWEEDNG